MLTWINLWCIILLQTLKTAHALKTFKSFNETLRAEIFFASQSDIQCNKTENGALHDAIRRLSRCTALSKCHRRLNVILYTTIQKARLSSAAFHEKH
jgi:hypothetical protein